MSGMLICFTGIDGSGKSTHARMLTKYLEKEGHRCRYVWIRWIPVVLKPLVFLIKIILFRNPNVSDNKDYGNYKAAKRGYFKRSFLASLWQNMVLFDYYLQIFVKIRIPLALNNIVVCDRYVYDTLVDFAVDSGYTSKQVKKTLGMRILSIFPKGSPVFLLDVPEEVAFSRKDDIPSLAYLTDRRIFYLVLAKELDMAVLDNSCDFDEVQKKIRERSIKALEAGGTKETRRTGQ